MHFSVLSFFSQCLSSLLFVALGGSWLWEFLKIFIVFDDLDTLEERWWEICRLPLSWDSSVFPGEGIWGESLRGEVAFALHQVASLPSDMWRWVLTPITPQRRRFSGLPTVLSLRSVFPRCPLWTQVCAPGVGVLTPVPEAQRPQKLFYMGEFAFFLHLCL